MPPPRALSRCKVRQATAPGARGTFTQGRNYAQTCTSGLPIFADSSNARAGQCVGRLPREHRGEHPLADGARSRHRRVQLAGQDRRHEVRRAAVRGRREPPQERVRVRARRDQRSRVGLRAADEHLRVERHGRRDEGPRNLRRVARPRDEQVRSRVRRAYVGLPRLGGRHDGHGEGVVHVPGDGRPDTARRLPESRARGEHGRAVPGRVAARRTVRTERSVLVHVRQQPPATGPDLGQHGQQPEPGGNAGAVPRDHQQQRSLLHRTTGSRSSIQAQGVRTPSRGRAFRSSRSRSSCAKAIRPSSPSRARRSRWASCSKAPAASRT